MNNVYKKLHQLTSLNRRIFDVPYQSNGETKNYLDKRYQLIVAEMKRRTMKSDPDRKFKSNQFPKNFYNDWFPHSKDLEIIRQRIQEKIDLKPGWYKWY